MTTLCLDDLNLIDASGDSEALNSPGFKKVIESKLIGLKEPSSKQKSKNHPDGDMTCEKVA